MDISDVAYNAGSCHVVGEPSLTPQGQPGAGKAASHRGKRQRETQVGFLGSIVHCFVLH